MKLNWQIIKKAAWYRQRTDSLPYFILEPIYGAMKLLNAGEKCIFHLGRTSNELFYDENFMNTLARNTLRLQKKNPRYLNALHDNWLKIALKLEKQIQIVLNADIGKISDQELVYLNHKIAHLSRQIWQQKFFLDIFDTNSENFIEEELNKYSKKPTIDEIRTLTLPSNLLETQKYQMAIATLTKKTKKPAAHDLKKIIKRFYFIKYGYAGGNKITPQELNKEIKEINKQRRKSLFIKLKDYQNKLARQKYRIIKQYDLGKKTVSLFDFFSHVAEWRDQRKTLLQKTVFALETLGKELAKRSKIPWKRLGFCAPYEIKNIRQAQKLTKKYQRLFRDNVLIVWNKDMKGLAFIKGRDYQKIIRLLYTINENVKEIFGQSANRGSARGIVKVIHGEKDFNKFKKSEILVTAMTRPEFLPIMKHAKAIITDEGGITSHAAIVSRELNIPCIIGTKIATQVFKDGDLVLINANKGWIKKLK